MRLPADAAALLPGTGPGHGCADAAVTAGRGRCERGSGFSFTSFLLFWRRVGLSLEDSLFDLRPLPILDCWPHEALAILWKFEVLTWSRTDSIGFDKGSPLRSPAD